MNNSHKTSIVFPSWKRLKYGNGGRGACRKMGLCVTMVWDRPAVEGQYKLKQQPPSGRIKGMTGRSLNTTVGSVSLWQLWERVKTVYLMASEFESIFEPKSPNPEGMIPRKKGKRKQWVRGGGLWV